jgi:hypothetical protein
MHRYSEIIGNCRFWVELKLNSKIPGEFVYFSCFPPVGILCFHVGSSTCGLQVYLLADLGLPLNPLPSISAATTQKGSQLPASSSSIWMTCCDPLPGLTSTGWQIVHELKNSSFYPILFFLRCAIVRSSWQFNLSRRSLLSDSWERSTPTTCGNICYLRLLPSIPSSC